MAVPVDNTGDGTIGFDAVSGFLANNAWLFAAVNVLCGTTVDVVAGLTATLPGTVAVTTVVGVFANGFETFVTAIVEEGAGADIACVAAVVTGARGSGVGTVDCGALATDAFVIEIVAGLGTDVAKVVEGAADTATEVLANPGAV